MTVNELVEKMSIELHKARKARKLSTIREHIRKADWYLFQLDETIGWESWGDNDVVDDEEYDEEDE